MFHLTLIPFGIGPWIQIRYIGPMPIWRVEDPELPCKPIRKKRIGHAWIWSKMHTLWAKNFLRGYRNIYNSQQYMKRTCNFLRNILFMPSDFLEFKNSSVSGEQQLRKILLKTSSYYRRQIIAFLLRDTTQERCRMKLRSVNRQKTVLILTVLFSFHV